MVSDRDEQDRICRQHGALSFPVVVVDDVYAGGFTHVVHLHAQGKLPTIAGLDPAELGAEPDSDRPRVGSLEGYAALGRLMGSGRNDGR